MARALSAVVAVLAMTGTAHAADGSIQKAYGTWSRSDGQARVRLAPCGSAICAVNVWVRDPAGSEKIGDRLVMKLRPVGAGAWSGTAYDPQRALTYAMTMTLLGEGLQTRGCILGGIICRNVGWKRIR